MSHSPRTAEQSRQALLRAAQKLFVERGFDRTRVDDVARAACINKRMIYAYFGSKAGLYQEVLRTNLAAAVEQAGDIGSAAADPAARVEATLRWYFRYLATNPDFVHLLGRQTLDQDRWPTAELIALAMRGLGRLGQSIEDGIRAGVFRPDMGVREVEVLVHSALLGLFWRRRLIADLLHHDPQQPDPLDRLLDNLVTLVLRGLRA